MAKIFQIILGVTSLSFLTACGQNFTLESLTGGHDLVIEHGGEGVVPIEEIAAEDEELLEANIVLRPVPKQNCMHGEINVAEEVITGWIVSTCEGNGRVTGANLYFTGTQVRGSGPRGREFSNCVMHQARTSSPLITCRPQFYKRVVINGKAHYGKFGFRIYPLNHYDEFKARNVNAKAIGPAFRDSFLEFSPISMRNRTTTAQPLRRLSCVNRYCAGRNAVLYPVANAAGRSNGELRARCRGHYYVDTRGSFFQSRCSTGWEVY